MKRIVGWLLLLVPLAAGALALWREFARPVAVRVARVERGPAQATVFATGWIEPRERRLLRPQRPAILERIFAREGEEVRGGSPLLRLRDSAREVKKERVKAELDRVVADLAPGSSLRAAAEARISEARVNESWARSEVERVRPLRDAGLVADRVFEQHVAERDAAAERVRVLTDELAHALAALATARRQSVAELDALAAAEKDDLLVAPFDGVVLARFAEEGEAVDPQRDLMKFGDVRDLLVEGEVDEEDVSRVAVGQKVHVRISGDEGERVEGVVVELFPDSNKATRSYRVRVSFPGARFAAEGPLRLGGTTRAAGGRPLLPGSSCELAIVTDERADVLILPRVALTAESTVFVAEEGVARARRVEIGLRNYDVCEARSGLSEGDLVAIERLAELRDGRRVRVVDPPAAAAAGVVELGGGPVDPLAAGGARAVVLLFTRTDCPISNKYAPEVNRLVSEWQPRGAAFWLIYVDRDQTEAEVRQHVRDYAYACRVALDRRHELVDLTGATITPEAAVFAADRTIRYVGRIDDRFADLGVQRAQPTSRDLEDALAAVLDGRLPAIARAPAVGCAIDDLR